jgi:membrane protein
MVGKAQEVGSESSAEWHAHGRSAKRPAEMPRRAWRDVLLRLKDDISEKNLSLIAAGTAFYAFIAIPSAFTALIALYGLAFNPGDVQHQVQAMQGVMPGEAIKLITNQLTYLTSQPNKALGIGFAISLLVALWSVTSGTTSMMTALNIVYGEREKRSLIKFYAIGFALAGAVVLFGIVSLALIAVLPAVLGVLPFGELGKNIASAVRWPILLALVMVALALIFRFAPSREEPKWRWVTWGAVAAALLWIVASALFSLYVGRFASYDKTYGSLAGVVVLMMWLYVSGFAVLLGAGLNAELEHQTARDSTTGREQPMGHRGAVVADTLGEKKR